MHSSRQHQCGTIAGMFQASSPGATTLVQPLRLPLLCLHKNICAVKYSESPVTSTFGLFHAPYARLTVQSPICIAQFNITVLAAKLFELECNNGFCSSTSLP